MIKMHAIYSKFYCFELIQKAMQEYIAPTPLFMLSLHHHGIRFSADSQGQYLPHLTSKPVNLNQLSR